MSQCPLCHHEVLPCVVQEVISQTNYEVTLDQGGFLIADTAHPRKLWDSTRYYERYYCPACQKPLTEVQAQTMLTEPAHTYVFEELCNDARRNVIERYQKLFGKTKVSDYIIVEIIETEPTSQFYADGTSAYKETT